MPAPERVLLDRTAIESLAVAGHSMHDVARQVYESLIDQERALLTTSLVVANVIESLDSQYGRGASDHSVHTISRMMRIFWVNSSVHNEALSHYRESSLRELSFLDWTTLVSARRTGAHVFTFNPGFAENGLPVLP